MKLRRALTAAAATAVIGPAALLAAPIAYADTNESPQSQSTTADPSDSQTITTEPSDSQSTTAEPSDSQSTTAEPSDSQSTTAEPSDSQSTTADPSDSQSTTADPSKSESTTPTEEPGECTEGHEAELDVSFSGLPGKIEAGSGWHKFSMNVNNPSKSTVSVDYYAAASADEEGEYIFRNKQVVLQAYHPDTRTWEDVSIDGVHAVDYVGYTEHLKPGYEVNIPFRINVKANAPVGAGFTLGAGVYLDEDENCFGASEASYKFMIVAPGTHPGNTKPQEGGKVPVPTEKPDHSKTSQVSGSLAETGSSSALPAIATIGGVAMAIGAGAIFAVRRRKTADSGTAA
jgi:LPXTG-motif cell wall-anchored protein